MRNLVYHEAVLIGVWLETLTYGLYVPLFFTCLFIVFARRRTRRVNWALLCPTFALFVLCTIHVSLGISRLLDGFIRSSNPAKYYLDLARWKNIFSDALYVTINFIGDSVVIYRCYVIWGSKKRVIIFPALCLLGSFATAIYAVVGFNEIPPGDSAFVSRISAFYRSTFTLSFVVNFTCTALIAYRITRTARSAGPQPDGVDVDPRPYYSTLAAIVESAAIYTVSMAIYIGLYFSQLNAQYTLYLVNTQIIGIVPTLILVRIGLTQTRSSDWDTRSWTWPYYESGMFIPEIQTHSEGMVVTHGADSSGSIKTSRPGSSQELRMAKLGES
ncbi:hypothetical protein BOTBODRAFT_53385 [Botryobasidium botryosum FD-172 SS1]|uniref:Uncharacterized protein n=1 Tax=Botryobasidium botryosum (strain FD-172 SS1) TaxID=930990 RepID=A0A067MRA9_BOTB1|nr:hypothetical protein BOTBODRAFT_53385 [Botryobasidium botryosum FD-172 SS1]